MERREETVVGRVSGECGERAGSGQGVGLSPATRGHPLPPFWVGIVIISLTFSLDLGCTSTGFVFGECEQLRRL